MKTALMGLLNPGTYSLLNENKTTVFFFFFCHRKYWSEKKPIFPKTLESEFHGGQILLYTVAIFQALQQYFLVSH